MYTPTGLLIPMPDALQNNVDAVIKPFNFWVTSCLALTECILFINYNSFFAYTIQGLDSITYSCRVYYCHLILFQSTIKNQEW